MAYFEHHNGRERRVCAECHASGQALYRVQRAAVWMVCKRCDGAGGHVRHNGKWVPFGTRTTVKLRAI